MGLEGSTEPVSMGAKDTRCIMGAGVEVAMAATGGTRTGGVRYDTFSLE